MSATLPSVAHHKQTEMQRGAIALVILAATALGGIALWWSMLATPTLAVDVGEWGDHAYLSNINDPEVSSTESYRWTTDQTQFQLPNLGPRYRVLAFRAHAWRPEGVATPILQLGTFDHAVGAVQMTPDNRIYHVLLPREPLRPTIDVTFTTPAFVPAGEQRTIGVGLDWLKVSAAETHSGPAPLQIAGQTLLLGLLLLLVRSLNLPMRWMLALGMIAFILPIVANIAQPLWISAALFWWLGIVGGLLLLTILGSQRFAVLLAPWLSARQAQIAWAVLMFALLIRLAGAVHPLFDMHDLPYHTRWMNTTAHGELYIYSTPSEFRSQRTFNPPAGYVLLMPLALLLDPRLTVQFGVALLDGMSCLLIVLIARELRLSARAGILALAASAAFPISMTMLWWGFATNALAQPLWLLLVWLLLRLLAAPRPLEWSLVLVVGVVGLLTHVGALVLVAATLGVFLLMLVRRAGIAELQLLGALAGAAVIAAVLYFSLVMPSLFGQSGRTLLSAAVLQRSIEQFPARWQLFSRGVELGYTLPGLALTPLGLFWLSRGDLRRRALAVAWLVAGLASIAAYFSLGLIVRDLYFLAPLVCLSVGIGLDLIWRHGGRWLAVALIGFITWQGLALWISGILLRDKPSGTPLIR